MTREPSPLFLGSLPLFPSPPPLTGSPPVPCPGSSICRQPGSCNTSAQRGRHPWQSHTAICAGRAPPGEQLAGFTAAGAWQGGGWLKLDTRKQALVTWVMWPPDGGELSEGKRQNPRLTCVRRNSETGVLGGALCDLEPLSAPHGPQFCSLTNGVMEPGKGFLPPALLPSPAVFKKIVPSAET